MKELDKLKKANLLTKKNKFQPNLTSAIRRAFGLKIGLIGLLALFEDCGSKYKLYCSYHLGYI